MKVPAKLLRKDSVQERSRTIFLFSVLSLRYLAITDGLKPNTENSVPVAQLDRASAF